MKTSKDQDASADEVNHTKLTTYPSSEVTGHLAADRYKYNAGKSGLAGFIKNPYVCLTAVFASIGGILFGCKRQRNLFKTTKKLMIHYRRSGCHLWSSRNG